MTNDKSRALFKEAEKYIPGGVNSPVRAGKAVGVVPPFIARAKGSHVYDVDGNDYIDFVSSWGPTILGHAHKEVVAAVERALEDGTSYGAPTEREVEMARTITEVVPSVELVRMVNSGTEATMSALRLARGFTGRDIIVKFDGCYHGHSDALLIKSGSGVATLGIPGSPGVPQDIVKNTVSMPYNDIAGFADFMKHKGSKTAAVIVEPVAGNMGVVPPGPGFLEELRTQTEKHGALLIFDEVITGFRLALGGAQERFGIMPDLTCLGKIIGGGLPVGAYGGREDIMRRMAPDGDVYQAGTLSGNPLAMAAGLATLKILREPYVYDELEDISSALWDGMEKIVQESAIPLSINRVGSLGTLFFGSEPVTDFTSAMACSAEQYAAFYRGMLERSVYLAPSAFEAMFLSLSHTREELEHTLEMIRESLASIV